MGEQNKEASRFSNIPTPSGRGGLTGWFTEYARRKANRIKILLWSKSHTQGLQL